MEINNTGSTYGAAFRQKPIFFMSGKETVAFFEGKLKKNMTLQEDSCTLGSNDTYRRQHTTYEVSDKKKGSTFLDLDFLIKDETSSLKGNLSDKKDVDFYNFSIPFNRTIQNYFGVQIYMDMPEGCDYDLTLYDEYGNQVGREGEARADVQLRCEQVPALHENAYPGVHSVFLHGAEDLGADGDNRFDTGGYAPGRQRTRLYALTVAQGRHDPSGFLGYRADKRGDRHTQLRADGAD